MKVGRAHLKQRLSERDFGRAGASHAAEKTFVALLRGSDTLPKKLGG
jgi:hypothetical protein